MNKENTSCSARGSKRMGPVTALLAQQLTVTHLHVPVLMPAVAACIQEASAHLDKLLMGCLAQKKDMMERSVVDDGSEQ